MKKLTIIIPTYNSEKYIEKCIISILKQTYTNLEIIIIDDNSSDNTYEICQKIQKDDLRIKPIRNSKNEGVSITRNLGIDIATGEYITFVDSDDYIEENLYEKLIEKIENENIDIAMCNFYMELNSIDTRNNSENKEMVLDRGKILDYMFLPDYYCGFVWNKIYKTDIIKSNNLRFDNNIFICEDMLFNCQYISKIEKGSYTTAKLYHYIQRTNSSYNTKYNERWKTVIQAYEKMRQYISEQNIKNFQYSYLYALLNLKEKIYMEKFKEKELLQDINNRIKDNRSGIQRNKNLSLKLKIKIYIKLYMLRLFLQLKKVKKFIVRTK